MTIEPLEARIAPALLASIDLSSLNGTNGFQLSGEAMNDRAGASVSAAGDVNGDGFADFIIGAPSANPNGLRSGTSYVIFGKADGFAANLDLSTLDGSNGFKISGEQSSDYFGSAVSGAGDVNNDGFDDLIIGTPELGSGGGSYVVFGHAGSFATNLNLSTLDGITGFQINAEDFFDSAGCSVSAAGDVNADGFGDLIIGAKEAGSGAGAAYVIFGKAEGFPANLNLTTLDGNSGFKISGEVRLSFSGRSVSGPGDINDDGFDDVLIRAFDGYDAAPGAAYVVFGKAGAFAPNLSLAALDGSNGFKISGDQVTDGFGCSVKGAGDINGDGFKDVLIGAGRAHFNGIGSGSSYVVFGHAGAFPANLNLGILNGSNGFRIDGERPGHYSGSGASWAGDVNGDGLDDLLIGALKAGTAYVVYGKASGFQASLNLAALDGSNGFRLNSETGVDYAGYAVSGAGDVNGDGFDDLLIGAPLAAPHDYSSGAAYVVFGSVAGPALPSLSIGDAAAMEGGDFGSVMVFTVRLSAASPVPVSVQIYASEGSATYLDYEWAFSQTLQFEPNEVSKTVTVNIRPDTDLETNEIFFMKLFQATNAAIADTTAKGTIINDDNYKVDATHLNFTEVDGDIVQVKITNSTIDVYQFGFAGDGSLQVIDLTEIVPQIKAADFTISATTPAGGTGDGRVNVGAINAMGVDLGAVKIDGNLGKIIAGNSTYNVNPALKSLTVETLGKLDHVNLGEGGEYHSVITGRLEELIVHHDVTAAEVEVIGGKHADIGTIRIAGSLRGDSFVHSGSIHAQGNIDAVEIGGDIVGGDGSFSGRIVSTAAQVGGRIKSILLAGSLIGGAGPQSGAIGSEKTIGSIVIGGSIDGGIIEVAGRAAPRTAKAALALGSLHVLHDVSDAFIGIGYHANGSPVHADVRLGSVAIDGDWTASSLAVGVADWTSDGFGQNDTRIAGGRRAIVATIASININGAAVGSAANEDFFGIVAERIRSATIHNALVSLTARKDDIPVDATNNDFRLVEI